MIGQMFKECDLIDIQLATATDELNTFIVIELDSIEFKCFVFVQIMIFDIVVCFENCIASTTFEFLPDVHFEQLIDCDFVETNWILVIILQNC